MNKYDKQKELYFKLLLNEIDNAYLYWQFGNNNEKENELAYNRYDRLYNMVMRIVRGE